MPTISQFYGISIGMFYNDHAPPHFHVKYAEWEAEMTIETLEIMGGQLPRRVQALVLEWAVLYRPELRVNWDRARMGGRLKRIQGLE